MSDKMIVVQCWDDGVTTDIPLMEILRRHNAKATFNLNIGNHGDVRPDPWYRNGAEISRMALPELTSVYEGFTIANHSVNHPHLEQIPVEEARCEIVEGRERLQQLFQQPVEGFAYPYGSYNDAVKELIREAGHSYARTCKNVEVVFPPEDPMEMHSHCHFLNADFMKKYEAAKKTGVFYFWGHSYEISNKEMWQNFEYNIKFISEDPDSVWADVADLFK